MNNGIRPQQQVAPPQVQGINVLRQGPIVLTDIGFTNGQVLRIPMPAGQAVQLAGHLVANAVDAAQETAYEHVKANAGLCPDCQVRVARLQQKTAEDRVRMVAAHQAGIQPPDAGEAPSADEPEGGAS